MTTTEPQTPANERFGGLFADWAGARPGGAVAVVRAGELVYRAAFGMADVATLAPFRPDHRFPIASVTKHMTVFCLLLLEREGLVSLDDRVADKFPGLLNVDAPITVRHLAANTSGLRDYITLATYAGGRLITDLRSPTIERLIRGQTSLNFAPGAEYSYSNSNFVVLSWIIARLTGRTFAEAMRERLFAPLGMDDTAVIVRSTDVPGNAVTGYAGVHAPFAPWHWDMDLAGEGGVWSTLDDLIRWERNLSRPVVGSAEIVRRMGAVQPLNDGKPSEYALGLRRGLVCGHPWEGHSGGWEGYRSFHLRLPQQDVGIIVIANHTAEIGTAAVEVAQACLPPPSPPERLAGVYVCAELETAITVTVVEGQLHLAVESPVGRQTGLQLCRRSDATFYLSRAAQQRWDLEFDTTVSFEAGGAALVLTSEPARGVRFLRRR
jgi:CubicO group peptidase (beta-lactamase class C family)